MNHLRWMGHSTTILDIQRNLRDEQDSCEITLVAKDHSIRAHRFVLSSSSDMMRAVLADVPRGEEATVIVPDMNGALLDSIMSFIYTGETYIGSAKLSEFLEAINTLGIKSAISFECNTAALVKSGALTSTIIPSKIVTTLPMEPEQILLPESMEGEKETTCVIAEQPQYLDVYNDPQHKITYSIEHIPGADNGNEYILTETAGTYTLTHNAKVDGVESANDSERMETEDEVDENAIIEDFSSCTDPIIEVEDNACISNSNTSNEVVAVVKGKHVKIKPDTVPLETSSVEYAAIPLNESYCALNGTALEAALELAVQAVINEGLSLQKAAVKYELSKTVLWRRVRKHPEYMKTARENPVLSAAYERLKMGESLKNISRDLDIPMSTLHRHKVRLAEQGRLPDTVTFKKRDPDSKNELKIKLAKAVHACVYDGMSQNHAANIFEIPKSTLWRHLQKRVAEAEMSERLQVQNLEPKEEIILS